MSDAETVVPLRQRQKAQVRESILDHMVEALVSGDIQQTNHDALARVVGVSRMTVYRHFPDREALMEAVWDKVQGLAGPNVRFPRTETELVSSLPDIHQGFDRIAPLLTLLRSTPNGRAARIAQRDRRAEAYTAALADAVSRLPDHDRKLATAVLQGLHTSLWLEMRDQWGLSGAETAEACGWAMRTLLKDLRDRGTRPLNSDEPVVSAGGV